MTGWGESQAVAGLRARLCLRFCLRLGLGLFGGGADQVFDDRADGRWDRAVLSDFLGDYLVGFGSGVLQHFVRGFGAGGGPAFEEFSDFRKISEWGNTDERGESHRGLFEAAVSLLAFEGLEGAVLGALMHLHIALEACDLLRLFGVGGIFDGSGFEFTQESGGAQQAAAGMDQAIDEERLGGALGAALGRGLGADGGELGRLVALCGG